MSRPEHPETRRYLGGPDGPAAMLARAELAFVELFEAGVEPENPISSSAG